MSQNSVTTDEQARLWLRDILGVSRETEERLAYYVTMLRSEAEKQNLISASTFDTIWARHIVDGAQLINLADAERGAKWLDLGSGPGLPGLVIALCADCKITLVESRARRIDFLQHAVTELDLSSNVTIKGSRLEHIETEAFDVITARAFAPLPKLLDLSRRFSTKETKWLLPKGKNAINELANLPKNCQNMFHVEHSVTSDDAKILVGIGRPNGN
jgi:16S rRNA (guanine527-N7)-methyltransferase